MKTMAHPMGTDRMNAEAGMNSAATKRVIFLEALTDSLFLMRKLQNVPPHILPQAAAAKGIHP